MIDRATLAIVRRHVDRRFACDWLLTFAFAAAMAYAFYDSLVQPLFPLAIASVTAAAIAAQRSHAIVLRGLTFFAMPLYGRQLARAHAIAPAILMLSIPLGYAAGAAGRHRELSPEVFTLILLASLVATLISLSSIFRDGYRAVLYLVMAAGTGTLVTALPGMLAPAHALSIAAALTAIVVFLALRAFGETLARYDPIAP